MPSTLKKKSVLHISAIFVWAIFDRLVTFLKKKTRKHVKPKRAYGVTKILGKNKVGCQALLDNPKVTFDQGSRQEIPTLCEIPSFFSLRGAKM